VIGIDDELTPALERALEPVARRALAGDWAARDALHAAFEPKLMRFVRRIRVPFAPGGTAVGIWERDDVMQESYLVFVDLVANWTPGIPFGRYVLANFPWRLRDAIHRGIGKRNLPPRSFGITPEEQAAVPDDTAIAAEHLALIDVLGWSLEPPLDAVFHLRLVDQLTMQEIADRLGVSKRSASRHWRNVLVRLRDLRQ
jgi:RNA polymerase sigma factor (sigma-70 family)